MYPAILPGYGFRYSCRQGLAQKLWPPSQGAGPAWDTQPLPLQRHLWPPEVWELAGVTGAPQGCGCTADTPVASLALMGQTPYSTLKEKVLHPASPGSGLIALTCVCPRFHPAPAWPTLLTLPFEAQLAPVPQEGLLPAPTLPSHPQGVCSREVPSLPVGCRLCVPLSPGVRLPASLSCAL